MKRIAIAAIALALTACATAPTPPPAVVVRTVEVDRPLPVPCVKQSDIPTMPEKVGSQLNGDAVHDLDIVAAALIRAMTALDKSAALLSACTTINP
jgi:hypothetical protein